MPNHAAPQTNVATPGHAKGWTPERRARQAALIRSWRPWARSTGPTSVEGKARAARNAWKDGERAALRREGAELHAVLRPNELLALAELAPAAFSARRSFEKISTPNELLPPTKNAPADSGPSEPDAVFLPAERCLSGRGAELCFAEPESHAEKGMF